MNISISELTVNDIETIDELMKQNSKTLGFLPKKALLDYLKKGGVLGAKADNGEIIGYLLYATYRDRFRIAQLCVSKHCREKGVAKKLVSQLRRLTTTQKSIKLWCRRDFPADKMWPKLGFVPLHEKPGRSAAGHPLKLWYFQLASDDQLDLFKIKTSDETLDVIIDAQIFFNFDKPDSDKTKPSKALCSDFLTDSINLCITNELFMEIHRDKDTVRRRTSLTRANMFPRAKYDEKLFKYFEEHLCTILPCQTESQKSDIKHLAQTAASDVKTFVTEDQNLLNKSDKISDLTNLQVLSPTDLIIRFHELYERQSYVSTYVSGVNLKWRRLNNRDISSFGFISLLNQGERKGVFRNNLEQFLVRPDHYECESLMLGNNIVAIRVWENSNDRILTIHLSRVDQSTDRLLFERFLVMDTISKAVAKGLDMVEFKASCVTDRLVPLLLDMNFVKYNDSYVRFCFSRCLDRQQVSSDIAKLCPESKDICQNMPDIKLERHCSPLNLESVDQKYFLIPIHPSYATSFFDTKQKVGNLFGGKNSVLLRWDNVYYRKKTLQNILIPPARILWYVSKQKQIVAVSHLDNVEIDSPKILFKKFKKFGILEWHDLYKMCGGVTSIEIMALKFSHTFTFRNPVPLDTIKTVLDAGDRPFWQSASQIDKERFHSLFQHEYQN